MDKDLKFTISVIQDEYTETVYVPKYEVLGTRKVEDCEVKEIGGGYEEPIYGKCIAYNKELKYHNSKVVGRYDQIPVMLADISFSVVNTSNKGEWYEEDKQVNSSISQMGKFCSIEKIYEFINASRNLDDPSYSLSYEYQYTDHDGKIISKENFKTQEERNKSACEQTGYDFNQLDWSDKIEFNAVENSTSTRKSRR